MSWGLVLTYNLRRYRFGMARPLRIEIENGIYHHFGDVGRPLQRRVDFP